MIVFELQHKSMSLKSHTFWSSNAFSWELKKNDATEKMAIYFEPSAVLTDGVQP